MTIATIEGFRQLVGPPTRRRKLSFPVAAKPRKSLAAKCPQFVIAHPQLSFRTLTHGRLNA